MDAGWDDLSEVEKLRLIFEMPDQAFYDDYACCTSEGGVTYYGKIYVFTEFICFMEQEDPKKHVEEDPKLFKWPIGDITHVDCQRGGLVSSASMTISLDVLQVVFKSIARVDDAVSRIQGLRDAQILIRNPPPALSIMDTEPHTSSPGAGVAGPQEAQLMPERSSTPPYVSGKLTHRSPGQRGVREESPRGPPPATYSLSNNHKDDWDPHRYLNETERPKAPVYDKAYLQDPLVGMYKDTVSSVRAVVGWATK
mmetsp:Transcript_45809/g.74736  ORF Transcript_45809/g.74736 Transcript_45809/m.74736 type:complete len:253 (-) Transcript_45809:160-918(-)|eukprot:CAMPEP_0184662142 /NCGR_PEP_ID=MMETSP0308-20130426/41857_1 /TAXON_ID=38269 /ORGANISM="Gloeochaete witrockiana, Strain SAG 46.84" /LENGTH=252 /DNA_ID=CAMNT_0027103943 /DNA_START=150 /DNA_END=908 /DNA_ORIENTATION=-